MVDNVYLKGKKIMKHELKGTTSTYTANNETVSDTAQALLKQLGVNLYDRFYIDTPDCKISAMNNSEKHQVVWQPVTVRYDGLHSATGEKLPFIETLVLDGLVERV